MAKKTLDSDPYEILFGLIREMEQKHGQGPAAEMLGIKQGFLSEILSRKRNAGAKVLMGLMAANPLGLAKVLGAQVELVQREPETFEEWLGMLGIDPDGPDAEVLQTQFKDLRHRQQGLDYAAAEVRRRQAARKGKAVADSRAAELEDAPTGRDALKVSAKPRKGKGK